MESELFYVERQLLQYVANQMTFLQWFYEH